MAQITVQKITLSGLDPAFVAADAAGDSFANDGKTVLHVKNGSAGAITVTINSERACSFGFDHDAEVSVPAGGERVIGPFYPSRFGTTVTTSYSAVASVTVAAVSNAP